MATSLVSQDCNTVSEANELFGREKGLLVLRPGGGCCSVWHFTIPSGCYALVTSHGADLDYKDSGAVWPSGLHFPYPPWIGVSHLVTKQSVVLDLPVKACKTKDNVTVNVDVALVFRIMGDAELGEDPEHVRNFVHQLKPRGLEQQLRDAQEEAVRGLARSLKHTEIYGIRSGGKKDFILGASIKQGSENATDINEEEEEQEQEEVEYGRDEVLEGTSDVHDRTAAKRATVKGESVAAMMRARLNKQFLPQGVEIQSVMIKSVRLPEDIESQMTEKTMVISQNAQQRMYHENEMQINRMEQQVETMLQSFHEQREEEVSSGNKKLNDEQVTLNDAIAQATKSEANIREATKVKIENLYAEASMKEQRVNNESYATVVNIESEAQKESAELLANTQLEVETLMSKAKLHAEKMNAKSELVMSKAEGKIAPWLAKMKEFETKKKEIEVYQNLAENENLIINGSTSDSVNLVAVADAILHEDCKMDDNDRSHLIAELALMSRGSSGFMPAPHETSMH